MILPARAPVKPRVTSPETGDALPLEETIESLTGERHRGAIEIVGGLGAGKTTALCHLAAVLPARNDVSFLDDADISRVAVESAVRVVVFSSRTAYPNLAEIILELTPWTDDELLEYLLAAHPSRCASVMRRVQSVSDRHLAESLPELWQVVLDKMAANDQVTSVRGALEHELAGQLTDADLRRLAAFYCLAVLLDQPSIAETKSRQLSDSRVDERLWRLLRYRPVQLMLAAEHVEIALGSGDKLKVLTNVLPFDLVEEIARGVAVNKTLIQRLSDLFAVEIPEYQAMIASILHACRVDWSPGGSPVKQLSHAYLARAAWQGIDLTGVGLFQTDLSHSDLRGAKLDGAIVRHTKFRHARLSDASITGILSVKADFTHADLCRVNANNTKFISANLLSANLSDANLQETDWQDADLSAASLCRANLTMADLRGAKIDETDLTDANLDQARLTALSLKSAILAGARFVCADLSRCDLEGVRLPRANFEHAKLAGAYLTGSIMPRANFRNADLRGAGLADIEWEFADLRGADLRGCSFHLGSTRSGLVGSPYPCHGSRTGFYTDDLKTSTSKRLRRSARPTCAAPICAGRTSTTWTSTWSTCATLNTTQIKPSTCGAAARSWSTVPN